MHSSNNAVVEPLLATIKLHSENGAQSVSLVAQCSVRMSGTRGPAVFTVDAPIAVDDELRVQIELLYSIIKRRVGLTNGEG
jgi:hypothetical protein